MNSKKSGGYVNEKVNDISFRVFIAPCIFQKQYYLIMSKFEREKLQGELMSFPPNVKIKAMVACGRHCSICHKFCGLKMQTHHIKSEADGGPDIYENAIPLCLDCHADMKTYDSNHPIGTKYTEKELIAHRDAWYGKVANSHGVPSGDTVVETDKQIYNKFIKTLPWDGAISFVDQNNFAGLSFEVRLLDPLYAFINLCDNPAFQFIDSDLEGLKCQLLSHTKKYTSLIGQNSFPCRNSNSSETRRNKIPEKWEWGDNSELYSKAVNGIHSTAQLICDTYKELINMGTRKLGVLPEELLT
jgi:HNH endonuclease